MQKSELIESLLFYENKLGKSPGRREVPYKLYNFSCKYFGSWNKAKEAANLKVDRRKCEPILKESKKYTLELVRIISYITGDGHLHKDLKGFLHSSQDINSLEDFEYCVKKQFSMSVSKIQDSVTTEYGEGAIQYRYFNTEIAKFLYSIGAPKGDKVITKFNVPEWIKENKEFMKEYLKILFYCEGSKYFDKNICKERIQINMRKTEDLIEEGKIFMNSLKQALKIYFDIETSNLSLMKGKKRNKDNKETKDIRFTIKTHFVADFVKKIGWLK